MFIKYVDCSYNILVNRLKHFIGAFKNHCANGNNLKIISVLKLEQCRRFYQIARVIKWERKLKIEIFFRFLQWLNICK